LATLEKTPDTAEGAGEWKARGAPTEIAIEVFASRFGWNRVQLSEGDDRKWQHVAEFPFDSDVKKMSVLFRNCGTQETHVFTKVSRHAAHHFRKAF
jgi:magnesium-transporting ATPase (P-type)